MVGDDGLRGQVYRRLETIKMKSCIDEKNSPGGLLVAFK